MLSRWCSVRRGISNKNQQKVGTPFAFQTQFFIDVQIGSNRWDFRTVAQIDAIQIDMQLWSRIGNQV